MSQLVSEISGSGTQKKAPLTWLCPSWHFILKEKSDHVISLLKTLQWVGISSKTRESASPYLGQQSFALSSRFSTTPFLALCGPATLVSENSLTGSCLRAFALALPCAWNILSFHPSLCGHVTFSEAFPNYLKGRRQPHSRLALSHGPNLFSW